MKIAGKTSFALFGILLAVGAASLTFYYQAELAHETKKLDLVGKTAAGVILESLSQQMMNRDTVLSSQLLRDFAAVEPISGILLLNPAGVVKASNDPRQVGRTYALGDEGCRECHGRGPMRNFLLGEETLRWVQPIENRPPCHSCHAPSVKVNGMLIVDFSIREFRAGVRKEILTGVAIFGAAFLAVSLLMILVMRRLVLARLTALGARMRDFAAGVYRAPPAEHGDDEIAALEAHFHDMAGAIEVRDREKDALAERINAANSELEHEIAEHRQARESIQRSLDRQKAMNDVLGLSLEEIPLEEVLRRSLDIVLSLPASRLRQQGSIALVDEDAGALEMLAAKGLGEDHLRSCRRVPLGSCFCGRAAATGETQAAHGVDDRHDIRYEGLEPHGHHCVPILFRRRVIGVLNLYLRAGETASPEEADFLAAIAQALASVIQRRKAEDALLASERRFRTLAGAATDAIFIVDGEARILYMNSAGARLARIDPAAMIGRKVGDFFPPPLFQRQMDHLRKMLSSGEVVYEETELPLPGGTIWMGTTLVPLRREDGTIHAAFGIGRDITTQKQAEEEREKLIGKLQDALTVVSLSHKEWQDTFDGITEMVAIFDRDLRIVKLNRAYADYFHAHPRELVDTKSCERPGGECPAFACPLPRALEEKRPVTEEVADPATKRIYRVTTFPHAVGGGEIGRIIHFARDITEEKERERRLILSERLAGLGQMASGIAHEINNPLASVAGCSEGLLLRLAKGQIDVELFRNYLNIIQEEVFRCKKITTAMLSFVRKTSYERRSVDLNVILEKTIEVIGYQGRLRSVEVVRRWEEPLPAIFASEGELRQVFLAVIANALDAMDEQGELLLETLADDERVTVRITDSGPGIATDDLERVFNPFFTTKAERGGTGLGLSIARRIVADHGGTIDLVPAEGRGTTVVIVLPVELPSVGQNA